MISFPRSGVLTSCHLSLITYHLSRIFAVSVQESPSLQERLTGKPPGRHVRLSFYAPAALGVLAAFVAGFPAGEWPVPVLWGWYCVLALGLVAAWRCWRLAPSGIGKISSVVMLLVYLAAFLLTLTR